MTLSVFYSISPFGTGDQKVVSDITIAGGAGVATFTVAQTGNIGVGCHVISDNVDGYISVMTNSTTATIVTALGAVHGNVSQESLTSISHEYASIAAYEAGFIDASHINDTDLTNADVIAFAPCYYDHDDGTVDGNDVGVSFGTTGAANYLEIYTPQGGTESINNQRHNGTSVDVSGVGYQISSAASTVRTAEDYINLIGLDIVTSDATESALGMSLGAPTIGDNLVNTKNCIIHNSSGTSNTTNLILASDTNLVAHFENTIGYTSGRNIDTRNSTTVTIINCTFYRHADQLGVVADTELTCTNTYCGKDSGTAEDFWTAGAAPSGSYNASSDGTAATDYTNTQINAAGVDQFTAVGAGSEDFNVKDTNADIYDNGTAVGRPATDIVGFTWVTDEIGAFAFQDAGGVTQDPSGILPAMNGAVTRQRSFNRATGGSI